MLKESIIWPKTIMAAHREVDISGLSKVQKKYYESLSEELLEFYRHQSKSRTLVGFTGPSGSGKTVSLAIVKHIIEQQENDFATVCVGLDAFHYQDNYLKEHFDNNHEPLKKFKGRYDTYDLKKFIEYLDRFSAGENFNFPEYSRKIHDPIENVIPVSHPNTLGLIEGLWFLYDKNGWQKATQRFDRIYFIDAEKHKDKVRDNVIERHYKGGRTLDDATRQYDENDAKNYNLVMETKTRADKVVKYYQEI